MKTIAALLLLALAAHAQALHCRQSARYDKRTLICATENALEVYRTVGGKQRKIASDDFDPYEPRDFSFGDTGTGVRIIIVHLNTHTRNPATQLYRLKNDQLIDIGELGGYWGNHSLDIDGDGVPELLSTACCHPTECATQISIRFVRWDGNRYQPLEQGYLDILSAVAGTPSEPNVLAVDAEEREHTSYRLVVLDGGGGLESGEVKLNGKTVLDRAQLHAGFRRIAVPLSLRGLEGCAEMTAIAYGKKGARMNVLIEIVQ